jgi:hypothetical protein
VGSGKRLFNDVESKTLKLVDAPTTETEVAG